MFQWIAGRIRCLTGRHMRCGERARRRGTDERYTSVCRFCGIPMERLAKRNWVVARRKR